MPHTPRELSQLQARRKHARRQRNLARADLGIGVLVALILLLLTPGLAISSLVAGVVLIACVASFVREARRRAAERAELAEPVASREAPRGSGAVASARPERDSPSPRRRTPG